MAGSLLLSHNKRGHQISSHGSLLNMGLGLVDIPPPMRLIMEKILALLRKLRWKKLLTLTKPLLC